MTSVSEIGKQRTIIRAAHRSAYFCMARASIQDHRLCLEARGLLAYLLSLPDDWKIQPGQLQSTLRIGRDKMRALLKELRDAGYIEVRTFQRGERSRFTDNEYIVHEVPFTENPSTVTPSTVTPSTENPSPYIVHTLQSTEEQKESVADATQAADTISSESKRGRKKNAGKDNPTPHAGEPPAPRPRDEMFDAVARHVFGFEDAGAEGGRVAKISNWLKGTYAGKGAEAVGFISSPAEPKYVSTFVEWWRAQNPNADVPRDLVKFVERWRQWASEANRKAQEEVRRQAQQEQRRAQAASQTAEERENALAALRAARAAQREAVAS